MSTEIMQRIARLTVPAEPPEGWEFLPRVESMRRCRTNEFDLLESLGREYASEQLEAARMLVRDTDGVLRPSPILAGDAHRLLILRDKKDSNPFDIVNQNGSLVGDDPPAFQCSRDIYTKGMGSSRAVLAACTDSDLAVLRVLGLPCTSAAGLARLDGSQASRLFDQSLCFGAASTSAGPVAQVLRHDYRIMLVAWQVAALNDRPPAGFQEIMSRLFQVEEVFGFDTSERVCVWSPNAADFRRICSAIGFADRKPVKRVMRESIQRSSKSIRGYAESTGATIPGDYEAARRELHRVLDRARQRGSVDEQLSKSLTAVKQTFDASVVASIVRDAMATANSVERSLLLMAADLMGDWHESVELLRKAERAHEGCLTGRVEQPEPEELRDKLRVVDGLVKIHRELTRNK